MIVLMARYQVKDFDRFLTVFKGFEATRRDGGSTGHRLLRSQLGDPERVIAIIEFGSRKEAEAFAASRARETALVEAGVLERMDEILEDVTP